MLTIKSNESIIIREVILCSIMFHNVVQIIPTEDYTVCIYSEDSKIVCFDVKLLAWDIAGNRDVSKCIDIDPDMLYELNYVADYIANNNN